MYGGMNEITTYCQSYLQKGESILRGSTFVEMNVGVMNTIYHHMDGNKMHYIHNKVIKFTKLVCCQWTI